jgi:hypothetical protein
MPICVQGLPFPPIACDGPILRSAFALRACTSSREASRHASQSEGVRSSRSVIYTPEALHFLEAPHIWLASNRTTFSVCAFCMAARTVAALIMSGAFFSSRVLYKSTIRGLPLPAIACDRPILRSASALRAHISSRVFISLLYEEVFVALKVLNKSGRGFKRERRAEPMAAVHITSEGQSTGYTGLSLLPIAGGEKAMATERLCN